MYIVASASSILERFNRSRGQATWEMANWHVGDNSYKTRKEALLTGIRVAGEPDHKHAFGVVHVFPAYKPVDLVLLDEKVSGAIHRTIGSRLWRATIGLDAALCLIEIVRLPNHDSLAELQFDPTILCFQPQRKTN
jgi:hypothetical protein